jgi:uncharacterized membrane protein YqjE
MENEAYLTINTFGIIVLSLIILALLVYSAVMTWHFYALSYVMRTTKYSLLTHTVMTENGTSGQIWTLYDSVKREKLLAKFKQLRVKPPEDVTFKELLPRNEREENPIQKMLS